MTGSSLHILLLVIVRGAVIAKRSWFMDIAVLVVNVDDIVRSINHIKLERLVMDEEIEQAPHGSLMTISTDSFLTSRSFV